MYNTFFCKLKNGKKKHTVTIKFSNFFYHRLNCTARSFFVKYHFSSYILKVCSICTFSTYMLFVTYDALSLTSFTILPLGILSVGTLISFFCFFYSPTHFCFPCYAPFLCIPSSSVQYTLLSDPAK